MYIGGANQDGTPQLSAKAIKSAIMFWWRTLNVAKHTNLASLYEEERRLFGGNLPSNDKEKARENVISPILFRLIDNTEVKGPDNAYKYLAYGLDDSNKTRRQHLVGEFEISVISKKPITESVLNAIKLFGLLGGLGGRSTKGLGSVSLISIAHSNHDFSNPENASEYWKILKNLITEVEQVKEDKGNHPNDSIPSIHHASISSLKSQLAPLKALSEYNDSFLKYRKSEFFEDDKRWLNGEQVPKGFHPQRAHFGMPHKYYKGRNYQPVVMPKDFERRESPLRFHVHQLPQRGFIGVLIHFKSDFLPSSNNYLKLSHPRKKMEGTVEHKSKERFTVIDDFLDSEELSSTLIYNSKSGEWNIGDYQ